MSGQTLTAPRAPGRLGVLIARRGQQWALPAILVVLLIVSASTTSSFLTFNNLRAVLINTAVTGVVAVGMTPITMSGNFFSMGISQSGMLATMIFIGTASTGAPVALAALLSLAVLLLIGVFQALAIALGLNAIVTTLAVGTIIFGITTWRTGGSTVTAPRASFAWMGTADIFGLPLPVYVFVVFTALMWFVTDRTVAGRRLTLVGANREAARTSGISVRAAAVWSFVFFSIGIWLAGLISAGELGQVTSSDMGTLTFSVIAAVLVGGTSIQGGDGSPVRSAVGALIIAVLGNVMLLHGLSTGAQTFGQGALVVVVILLLHVLGKAGQR